LAGHEYAIAPGKRALDGNEGDYVNAQRRLKKARPVLLETPEQPGTLR
jgi:hypothetical protein